jgi:hypothetical protein
MDRYIPFFIGVVLAVPHPGVGAEPAYVVRVTPAEFFSGDLKRLKGHLEFESAVCFKIKIRGAVRIHPDVEMWCDGERVDLPKYGYNRDDQSDELSFTVKRKGQDKVQYRAVVGGMLQYQRYLNHPKPQDLFKGGFGPSSVERPFVLKPGHSSRVVWAMGGGNGVDLDKPEGVDSQIKRLPWVMVFRLRVQEKPPER